METVKIELEPAQVLRLRPGDVVVVTHEQPLSQAAAENIVTGFRNAFEYADVERVPVVLLDDGMNVQVLARKRDGGLKAGDILETQYEADGVTRFRYHQVRADGSILDLAPWGNRPPEEAQASADLHASKR